MSETSETSNSIPSKQFNKYPMNIEIRRLKKGEKDSKGEDIIMDLMLFTHHPSNNSMIVLRFAATNNTSAVLQDEFNYKNTTYDLAKKRFEKIEKAYLEGGFNLEFSDDIVFQNLAEFEKIYTPLFASQIENGFYDYLDCDAEVISGESPKNFNSQRNREKEIAEQIENYSDVEGYGAFA